MKKVHVVHKCHEINLEFVTKYIFSVTHFRHSSLIGVSKLALVAVLGQTQNIAAFQVA